MKATITLVAVLVVVLCTAAGCTHRRPGLVAVRPGVYVLADHPQSVFYSNDYYWLYDGGAWYRSPYYDRGWSRVGVIPRPLLRVRRPARYRHYRGRVIRPAPLVTGGRGAVRGAPQRVRPGRRGVIRRGSPGVHRGQQQVRPGVRRGQRPGRPGVRRGQDRRGVRGRGAPPGARGAPPGQRGRPPGAVQGRGRRR